MNNSSLPVDVDDSDADVDVCVVDDEDEEPAFVLGQDDNKPSDFHMNDDDDGDDDDDDHTFDNFQKKTMVEKGIKELTTSISHNINDRKKVNESNNKTFQIDATSNRNDCVSSSTTPSCSPISRQPQTAVLSRKDKDLSSYDSQNKQSLMNDMYTYTSSNTMITKLETDFQIEENDDSAKGDENLSDSPDENDNESSDENDDRFYFESDHLAFKNNKDYKAILKTLVVLEAQRIQAVKDLEDLHKWKDKALKDPIAFVESLQSKDPPKFPKRQAIASLPHIDWTQYLAATGLTKIPPGYLANTRRRFRAKGDAQSSELAMRSSLFSQDDNESVSSEGSQDQPSAKLVRGRAVDDNNPANFNRLWTTEEQERLEKLLHVYPPEDIEARRWEKIAKALGNRTAKQVSSRVQKYFIKLARAGLPIPGRAPHMSNHKKSKINPVSYRNSTFFPSWKPSVYMNEDEEETSSVTTAHSDDTPCVSDEEMIPAELKESAEYKELKSLKKFKKQLEESRALPVHNGYMCDGCGSEPLQGTRWHCSDCVGDVSFDICGSCKERNQNGFPNQHPIWHRLIPIKDSTAYMDGDYLAFEQHEGKYNYLDPNFIPKTR